MIEAYRHPWHRKLHDTWEFLRMSYEGGDDYIRNNLFSHPKEAKKYYERRIQRAIYPNHTRVIVDTFASQLLKNAIPRSAPDQYEGHLKEFWSNIDMSGTAADDFYEQVMQKAQVYGYVAVVVDRHEPGIAPQTRAEELDSGRRPYAYIVTPQDIVDWRVDARGRIDWIMIREAVAYERDFDEPYGTLEHRYRMWTRDGWQLFRVDSADLEDDQGNTITELEYVLIDEGTHPVGKVPVEFVFLSKRKIPNPVGESLITDIAPLTRRLLNLASLIDEQIYQHVFNIMVVPESTWDELEKVDFSVAGSIPVPDDAFAPYYLSPDVAQIEVIQKQIEATEQSIRFLSGLGRQNEQGKAAPSGLALAYQTTDKRALMSKFGQTMEDLETRVNEVALMWMDFADVDMEEIITTYNIELEPGEVEQALEDALKYESLGVTGEAAIENKIQATRAYLGKRTTPERLQEIIEDIQASAGVPDMPGMPFT